VDEWLAVAAFENGFASPYLDGDANLDGVVNTLDQNALALKWRSDDAVWSAGDFTGEGTVDSTDLNAIGTNWQQPIPLVAAAQSVPEPSTVSLAFFAFAAVTNLLRRRNVGYCHAVTITR
jgi:hypothetical protein